MKEFVSSLVEHPNGILSGLKAPSTYLLYSSLTCKGYMQDPTVYLNPYIVLKHRSALNENSPHRFLYLNTQFPVGSAVWRGSITVRSTVQQKKACHWGQVLRVDGPRLSVCSLCFRSGAEDVIFQLPAPVASSPPPPPGFSLWNFKRK